MFFLTAFFFNALYSNIISAQNLYVSLFIAKDYEIKSKIFELEPDFELNTFLSKIKNEIVQNISNNDEKKFALVSDFEIFKNLCMTNFGDKEKIFSRYLNFKKKITAELNYLSGDSKSIRLFAKNSFLNLKKMNTTFKKNYKSYGFELKELKFYCEYLNEHILKSKTAVSEPRLKFLSNYLIYLNEKTLAAYLDRDLKSIIKTIDETETIFEYIDNRLSLKNL